MKHPDVEEYEATLELVRVECVEQMRARAERARRLLVAIIHGEADADDVLDSIKVRH